MAMKPRLNTVALIAAGAILAGCASKGEFERGIELRAIESRPLVPCSIDGQRALDSSVRLQNGNNAYCFHTGEGRGQWREIVSIAGQPRLDFASRRKSECLKDGQVHQVGDVVNLAERPATCSYMEEHGFVWMLPLASDGNLSSILLK